MGKLPLLPKIIVAILIAMVMALSIVVTRLDTIILDHIQQTASATVGVQTRIRDLSLALSNGQMKISQLTFYLFFLLETLGSADERKAGQDLTALLFTFCVV